MARKPKGRKVGRKVKLDAAITKRLIDAFSIGATVKLACEYAGIGETTFYNYMRAGEEYDEETGKRRRSDNPFVKFRAAITRAKAAGDLLSLSQITAAAAGGDWRAAAWKLKRKRPEEYGDRIKVGADPDNPLPAPASPIMIDMRTMDPAQLRALAYGELEAGGKDAE